MALVDVFESFKSIGFYNIFFILLLIFIAVPIVWEGIKKWKVMLGKSPRELKDEDVDSRLNKLDKKIDDSIKCLGEDFFNKQELYHQQSITIREELSSNQELLQSGQQSLIEDVKELRNILQEYIAKDNEKTVATLRTSLWKMHKLFTEQGYVTPDSLKTFMEEGKVYEKAGGNDIYHDKLLPEVLDLDIHYLDGSIYKRGE